MTDSSTSVSWQRVAELTPRLRAHVRVHRHRYRGRISYVVEDRLSQRFLQLSPTAHALVARMDGQRKLREIWELVSRELGDEAPARDELVQLLSQLHRSDVLQSDVAPDVGELSSRSEERRWRIQQSRWMNPLSVRFPLLDPEPWLQRLVPWLEPLFGRVGFALWLLVVGSGASLAASHWSELSDGFFDRVFSAQNALSLWLVFPVMKALHELGHAAATKHFGGEVHEVGILLLIFTPAPYVDASAASAFPSRWQRIGVGAAGVVVELFLAAAALHLWAIAEPGLLRSLAYNAAVIGSVASFAFNLNPLLRYDGYFILSDWLEIPNLRARASAHFKALAERHLFGLASDAETETSPSERAWFVGFALAAFAYRMAVMAGIALFVLGKSFYLGAALLCVSAVGWFGLPLARGVAELARGSRYAAVRGRAARVVAGSAAAAAVVVGLIPVPLRTLAEGVVWIPDEAYVRAGAMGFVERIAAEPGARVEAGQLLFELRDSRAEADVAVAQQRVRELEVQHTRSVSEDRAVAALVADELAYARENLERTLERRAELRIEAQRSGTFLVPRAADLPGRFAIQGELLGYVVDLDQLVVRAVVPQSRADLVRELQRGAEVRLAQDLAVSLPARAMRVAPGGLQRLPATALGHQGGGEIAVDPRDASGTTAIERVFQVELDLDAPGWPIHLGGRAYVRFEHGFEPLWFQALRSLRQTFLSRLYV